MKSSPTFFMALLGVAAAGSIIGGLLLIDSPSTARMHKLDAQRISDLQRLSMNIGSYMRAHDHLPERLDQLTMRGKDMKDAATGQSYEYRVKDAATYELCAVFDTAPGDDDDRTTAGYYNSECTVPWWKHEKGRYCYTVSTKVCK